MSDETRPDILAHPGFDEHEDDAPSDGVRLRLRARAGPGGGQGHVGTLSEKFGPNMTPMVDVVLVILIFFMAATVVVGPELSFRTSVQRQTDASSEVLRRYELPPVRLAIRIDARDPSGVGTGASCDGLGLTGASVEQMSGALASFVEGVELDRVVVAIDPTPGAPYAAIVRLHETCARLGIKRVGVVLREADAGVPAPIGVE